MKAWTLPASELEGKPWTQQRTRLTPQENQKHYERLVQSGMRLIDEGQEQKTQGLLREPVSGMAAWVQRDAGLFLTGYLAKTYKERNDG